MKKQLSIYLLIAFNLFGSLMQGSFVDNTDYNDLVRQIVACSDKPDYTSIAKALSNFNKKCLSFNKVYSQVIIDDDLADIYDNDYEYEPRTALEDIAYRICDNIFDFNILRLLFKYGVKKEKLCILLKKKEKGFLTKIIDITLKRKGIQGSVDHHDVELSESFTSGYTSLYSQQYLIRRLIKNIMLTQDPLKPVTVLVPPALTFQSNFQKATALVFVFNGTYLEKKAKNNVKEEAVLPLMAEKIIKRYINQCVLSSNFWVLMPIYQFILHPKMYDKLLLTKKKKLLTTEHFKENKKKLEKQLSILRNQQKGLFGTRTNFSLY